jgi:hypothetical protein
LVDVTDGGKLLFNRTPAVVAAAFCSASLMRRGTEMISRSQNTRLITVITFKYEFSLNIHKECVYLLTWDANICQSHFLRLKFTFVYGHDQWSHILRMSRTRKRTCPSKILSFHSCWILQRKGIMKGHLNRSAL